MWWLGVAAVAFGSVRLVLWYSGRKKLPQPTERFDDLGADSRRLHDWLRETDALRHDVTARIMLPVYWSRIQEIDLDSVPTDGVEHDLSLFMEDTGWPDVPIDEYIKMWDELYSQPIARHAEGTGTVSIDIQACFQNAFGTGVRREAMLWQRIPNPETVLHLLTHDLDPEMRKPGTYMYDSLEYRDQWESKLLRTSKWSPLY